MTILIIAISLTLLIIIGSSSLGIYFTRKFQKIKNYTSKTQTIIFLLILTILVFFRNFSEQGNVVNSIGFTIGYIYVFTIPCAFIALFAMNKFKYNKKEFWNSWFFALIPILILHLFIE